MTFSAADPTVTVCHDCDTVQRVPVPGRHFQVRCVRCRNVLASCPADNLEALLALSVTTGVLFLVANLAPLLSLEVHGSLMSTSLSGAALAMFDADQRVLAVVVLFCTVLGPAFVIGTQIYVLAALQLRRRLPGARYILATVSHVGPWEMMDVFLLGTIVTMIKLFSVATIVPGMGLYAFAVLIPVFALTESQLDLHYLWDRMESLDAGR